MADEKSIPPPQTPQAKASPQGPIAKADQIVKAQDLAPLKAIVASGGPPAERRSERSNES